MTKPMIFVAPELLFDDLPARPWPFEAKLQVFEQSVLGWQLRIADQLINGSEKDGLPPIPHSGYATLSIVASYPEMIWQFTNGVSSHNKSSDAFSEGIALIFPEVDVSQPGTRDILKLIYVQLRCGLYHDGHARQKVFTSHTFPPLQMLGNGDAILVNPHELVRVFIRHFEAFVGKLREEGEGSEVGAKFVAFFDSLWRG